MAKLKQGILGGFSGKVGNVVGGSWNGIDYMRAKPANVKDPKTEAQMAQRMKFRVMMRFLRKVKPIIQRGFQAGSQRMSAVNRASSYNLKNAISGSYPDLEIDYPNLLVTRGDLMPADNVTAESSVATELHLQWNDNSGLGSAQPDDVGLLLVYVPEIEQPLLVMDQFERQDEDFVLDLPTSLAGKEVQTYLGWVSADGTEASDSQYLGPITVQT
jgi:hypothetical protein